MKGICSKVTSLFGFFLEVGKKVLISLFILLILGVVGIAVQSESLGKVFVALVVDVCINYCFSSWIMTEKYKLKQKAKKKGIEFEEDSYSLYWTSNKMRLNLMLRITLFFLAIVKYIPHINLASQLSVNLIAFLVGMIISACIIFWVPNYQIIEELYEKSKNKFMS